MDVRAIRDFMQAHPDGIEIHMVDGTVYRIPHRDYVWFRPVGNGSPGHAPSRFANAFYIDGGDHMRLVNSGLVEHVRPLGIRGPRKRPKAD